jgi:hypothetical protein
MGNFNDWMSKPIPKDEVIVWFNIHNMFYEKIELYGDIFKSLNEIIIDTYLGDGPIETRIILNDEDNVIHFEWCWKKLLENFKKENILIKYNGEHKDYMKLFFIDSFYYQKEKTVKTAIPNFINGVFNTDKVFAKSDLDILTELYKLIEKNIEYL